MRARLPEDSVQSWAAGQSLGATQMPEWLCNMNFLSLCCAVCDRARRAPLSADARAVASRTGARYRRALLGVAALLTVRLLPQPRRWLESRWASPRTAW